MYSLPSSPTTSEYHSIEFSCMALNVPISRLTEWARRYGEIYSASTSICTLRSRHLSTMFIDSWRWAPELPSCYPVRPQSRTWWTEKVRSLPIGLQVTSSIPSQVDSMWLWPNIVRTKPYSTILLLLTKLFSWWLAYAPKNCACDVNTSSVSKISPHSEGRGNPTHAWPHKDARGIYEFSLYFFDFPSLSYRIFTPTCDDTQSPLFFLSFTASVVLCTKQRRQPLFSRFNISGNVSWNPDLNHLSICYLFWDTFQSDGHLGKRHALKSENGNVKYISAYCRNARKD